ncbi:MAG: signal peptidase II [Pseudomonadota bacterium]
MTGATDLSARARDWWAHARSNSLFWRGAGAAVIIAALDQLSKYWIVQQVRLPDRGKIEISGVFDLTYVQNYGASFGMLSGMRYFLAALSIGISIGLLYWLGNLRRAIPAAGVAFVVGGALGNLYDRLAYGYVVDFLDFSGLMFPWVFNIADASINVGIALILLDAWLTREKKSAPSGER